MKKNYGPNQKPTCPFCGFNQEPDHSCPPIGIEQEEPFIVLGEWQYDKYIEWGLIEDKGDHAVVIFKNPFVAVGAKCIKNKFIPSL